MKISDFKIGAESSHETELTDNSQCKFGVTSQSLSQAFTNIQKYGSYIMDSSGLEQGPVVNCCKHGIEPSRRMKCSSAAEQLIKEDTDARIQLSQTMKEIVINYYIT